MLSNCKVALATAASFLLFMCIIDPYVVLSKNVSADWLIAARAKATTNRCDGTNEQLYQQCLARGGDLTDTNSTSTQQNEERVKSLTFPLLTSPHDPDGIPHRWLVMAKNNRQAALQAYHATLDWRKQHGVDTILAKPHIKFDQVKSIFPHYFPGRDSAGNIVFVQRPGRLRLDLKHELNVSTDEMHHHVVYVLEYCWNILSPDPNSTMTNILDLKDVSFSMFHNQELMSFVKDIVSTSSHHYPTRSYKTFVINAPRWFGALFNLLKPLLRESTREKIEIHSGGKSQDDALLRLLGNSFTKELMSAYKDDDDKTSEGPPNQVELGVNSIPEKQMRDFCVEGLDYAGMKMLDVR